MRWRASFGLMLGAHGPENDPYDPANAITFGANVFGDIAEFP